MYRGVFVLVFALLLVGQGCFAPATSIPLHEIDPAAGTGDSDGTVTFREGFGVLPGAPPTAPLTTRTHPSIILDDTLPSIPPQVTVLREWQTAPSLQLLRNITTAVGVPAGTFGTRPHSETLSLTWVSADDGYAWTYDAPAHLLTVIHPSPPTGTGAVRSSEQILMAVQAFLSHHGIETAGWGKPEVLPGGNGSWRVVFTASRDKQPVVDAEGAFLRAGELEGMGDTVVRGTLELPRSMDRSNYPAFTPGELLQRLRAGGTNPPLDASSNAVISFTDFSLILYQHEGVVNGANRLFYIPALFASGMLRDGATVTPYETTVPLVQDRYFEKSAQ